MSTLLPGRWRWGLDSEKGKWVVERMLNEWEGDKIRELCEEKFCTAGQLLLAGGHLLISLIFR